MALLELSKQREKFPELAPYLWNSFGTMAVLLQACCSGASVFTRVFGRFFGERMAQGRTHPSLASLSEMDCG